MSQEKKYVSLSKLSTFLDNLYNKFASTGHKHTLDDITNYVVDSQMSSTSTNPVQNKVLDAEFEAISAAMNALEDAIDGKSESAHNHDDKYYTEAEIDSKLSSKSDTTHKHDSLYDAKGAAATVQQNLNAVAAAKADVEHSHEIADITNLQSALDGKAASSHGTHVTYSTAAPAMNGTAAVGTAANVSRGDHVHPTDTSRASKVEFDTHTVDTTKHISSTERTNWNAAYTHSQSNHARIDATKVADSTTNGNILVNDSEVTVYSHPNSGVTAGTYKSVTVNAQGHVTAGSNPTTLSGYGITDAETKTDASAKLTEAKTYADAAATKVKNDLLNGAGTAYDTLKELGDLIDDNVDAIDALEKVAATKANASDLTSHTSNKSNPHGVTLAQLGVTATKEELNIMDGVTATAAEINVLDGITATTAELNYVDGVTSNIQTQLNAKQASITGAATTITGSNLTASRALVSDGNGKVSVSAVTSTELGYLDGVTSAIQTQLNGKAPSGFGLGTVAKDISNTDLVDTLTSAQSGWYRGLNVTNAPTTEDWYYFQVMCNNSTYSYVVAYKFDGRIYTAHCNQKGFSGWVEVYDKTKIDEIIEDLNNAINGKADTVHAHNAADITSGTLDLTILPTIPAVKGGTGETTLKKSANALINALETGGATTYPHDDDYFISQYAGGNDNPDNIQNSYYRRKMSTLWGYIKNKLTEYMTGGISSVITTNFKVDKAIISDADGKLKSSEVTATELGFLAGVGSSVQTQIDGKAPTSHASTATTYGEATGSNYGHVKLSDSTSSTSGVSGGVAATPAAVKAAYDALDDAKAPAGFGLGTTAQLITGQKLLDILPLAQSGWYHGSGVEGAPTDSWCYFEIIADSTNYSTINAYDFNGNNWRAYYNGTKATDEEKLSPWIGDSIATYTSLGQIGLTDNDMIAEDENSLATNLTKIIYGCPERSFIFSVGNTTNFTASLRAKLNYDLGTSWTTVATRCIITRVGGAGCSGKIEVFCDNTNHPYIYTAQFDGYNNNILLRPFIVTYNKTGFLSLAGGTLSGDTVKFKNGLGQIYTDASLLQLSAYNVADAAANSSHLQILNNAQSVAKTLQLVDYGADGKRTDYLVYGQHNKPTAADVGALALDGSNSMTGNLTIEKNTPIVKLRDSATEAGGLLFAANNRIYMQAANVYNSDNNRRQLQLADSDAQTLNRALFLVDIVDGTATGYNVYHEANKPTAADVGVSNENLLDNWYWLDPINSRGQTSYTGSYAFDRWHCGSNVSTVAWEFVEGKGIKITNNGTASVYVRQKTESGYPDGRYTVSILVTEITNQVSMYMSNSKGNTVNSALKTVSSTGLHTVTKDVTNFDRVQFTIPAGASVTIAAVKLECGSVQTLAHQDTSGNWVVNDCPPNKYMETLKCIQSTAVDNDTYANHTIYHSGNMTLDEIGAMPSQIGDVKKTLRTDLGSSWALADGANVAYDAAIAPYLPVTTGVAHYTAAAGYMGSGTTNPNRANLSYANGYYIVSGHENYTTSSDTWVVYMKPTSTSSTTQFVEDPNNEDTGHLENRTFIDVIYYNKVYYALCSDGKIYYYSSTGAPSSWSTTRSYNCTISDSYRLMMINSIPHIVAKDGLYKLTSLTTSSMTSTKVISTPSYVSDFHSFSYVNGNAIWSRYVNESSGTDHTDIAYCVYDGSTAGSISTSSCNFNDGTWLSDKRYSIIGFTYVDGVYYAVATNHSYKVGESLAGFSSCFTNELKSTIDYDTYHIVSFARTKFGTTVAVTTKGEDEDVVCVISSNDATSDISNITDWSVIDTEGYYTSDSDYKYCYLPMVGFYEYHYNNKERFTYFMHSSLDGNARRNNLCRITIEKKLPVIETEKGINTYIKVQ